MCCQALVAPKRVMALLNRLGIGISYDTIRRCLTRTATSSWDEVKRLCASVPTVVVYDNCNIDHAVGPETSVYRVSQFKLTVNFIYELHAPGLGPGPLLRDLCFKKEPDYMGAELVDVLLVTQMGSFWKSQIAGLICDIMWEEFGEGMSEVRRLRQGRRRLNRPVIHAIEFRIDELLVLSTLPIDSGTTAGNAQVLEATARYTGLDRRKMMDKVQPHIGDLGTTLLQRNLLNYKKRDVEDQRLSHVDPWSEYLHMHFDE